MLTTRAPDFQNTKAQKGEASSQGHRARVGLGASLCRCPAVSPPLSGSQISWAQAVGLPSFSASSSIPCRRYLGLWASCCPKEEHRKLTPCHHRSLRRPPSPQAALGAKARPAAASPVTTPQQGIVFECAHAPVGVRLVQQYKIVPRGKRQK